MLVLLILIYRFNEIPIKIPSSYLVDIDKVIIKLTWEEKRPRIANTILKMKKDERRMLPNFKIFSKAVAIMTGGLV